MTLKTDEFIRRFLIHVLPKGQHRIRHYGFFGNGTLNGSSRAKPLSALSSSKLDGSYITLRP
jgi:hypothetical protein